MYIYVCTTTCHLRTNDYDGDIYIFVLIHLHALFIHSLLMYRQRMYILSTYTCVVYVLLTQHITNIYILHTRCACASYVHVQRMYIPSTSHPYLDVNICLTQVDMSFNMFSIHRQPCMVNIVNYLSSHPLSIIDHDVQLCECGHASVGTPT